MNEDRELDADAARAGAQLRSAIAQPAPALLPIVQRARARRRRRAATAGGIAFSGAAIVASSAFAVVAGRGTDGPRAIQAGMGGTTTTEATPTETNAPPMSETTGLPVTEAHNPNEVKVLVANGSGTKAVAGGATSRLVGAYYAMKPAADADQLYEQSRVFYREGYATDALAVARILGAPEPAESFVAPMPVVLPVRGTNGVANAQDADVLVIMGTDELLIPS
jgi:hypothetical protein